MSFSMDVKDELARLVFPSVCCRKAELFTLLRMSSVSSSGGRLDFFTGSASVARKVLVILKKEIPGVKTGVVSKRSPRLGKKLSYGISIVPGEEERAKDFWKVVFEQDPSKHLSLIKKQCCHIAVLRGAFLAGGTVNRPEAPFHLEIGASEEVMATFILGLLKREGFHPGFTERKEKFVVYLKECDAILDFLGMLSAEKAVEALEVARNVKEVRSQVNRLVNCETANLERAVSAAGKQLDTIAKLEQIGKLSELSKALQEAAKVRLQNPEASIGELAKMLYISKSAMNHRLRNLASIARNICKE